MNPEHWLDVAEQLLRDPRRGAPRQVNLRCAVSLVYYALFHWLANCAADALAGTAKPRDGSWTRVYRGLQHHQVRNECRKGRIPKRFPTSIRRFATEVATMQNRRHRADYDPQARFSKGDALAFLRNANSILNDLQTATPAEKRAFAIHVLFKERPGSP